MTEMCFTNSKKILRIFWNSLSDCLINFCLSFTSIKLLFYRGWNDTVLESTFQLSDNEVSINYKCTYLLSGMWKLKGPVPIQQKNWASISATCPCNWTEGCKSLYQSCRWGSRYSPPPPLLWENISSKILNSLRMYVQKRIICRNSSVW